MLKFLFSVVHASIMLPFMALTIFFLIAVVFFGACAGGIDWVLWKLERRIDDTLADDGEFF